MERTSKRINQSAGLFIGRSKNLLFGQIDKKVALKISILITLVVMVIELIASKITGSLMLFSDGLHMLTHAMALGVSLMAFYLSGTKASERYPFGLKNAEVLAAILNGFGLIIFTGYIFYESYLRLLDPRIIDVNDTLLVAVIGLSVNLFTAWILFRAGIEDLNTKGAYLHLLADTFSSVAIIGGAIVISYTNWFVIDPLLSLMVGLVILKWSLGLLWDASKIILHKAPLRKDDVLLHLTREFPEIHKVEELLFWENSPGHYISAGKLIVFPLAEDKNVLRQRIKYFLREKFDISTCYLEIIENEPEIVISKVSAAATG